MDAVAPASGKNHTFAKPQLLQQLNSAGRLGPNVHHPHPRSPCSTRRCHNCHRCTLRCCTRCYHRTTAPNRCGRTGHHPCCRRSWRDAAMGVNPCTYTNKIFGLSVVENTSKISVLLGDLCINFEIFYIDQYLKPLFPTCSSYWTACR